MIKYLFPNDWIKYEFNLIAELMVETKASIASLRNIPYQRSWVESLQEIELKREVAGTTKIEGADFTEKELEDAIKESADRLQTRSQRQAKAAVDTYRWIAKIPSNQPLGENLVKEIHRKMVTGADEDHCRPGVLRKADENVTFGSPRHRGAEGGDECQKAFEALIIALNREFKAHDPIVQALAAHYHLASIHPFSDGNGRTARALEALLLQRAGLKDICFVAMSNYYYDEKPAYLQSLSKARIQEHDLTPFIMFGLRGIIRQINRILDIVKSENAKVLFRNLMYDLFHRLETPKKRVIAERQMEILKLLLDHGPLSLEALFEATNKYYNTLTKPHYALIRDISRLMKIDAVKIVKDQDAIFEANLKWPMEITETEFFERIKRLPKAKTHTFLE